MIVKNKADNPSHLLQLKVIYRRGINTPAISNHKVDCICLQNVKYLQKIDFVKLLILQDPHETGSKVQSSQ